MKTYLTLSGACLISLICGCATTEDYSAVEEARTEFQELSNNQQVKEHAAVAYQKASEAMEKTNQMAEEGKDRDVLKHQAYLTKQRIAIARETAQLKMAENQIEEAQVNRKDALLEAREQEIQQIEQRAQELASQVDEMKAEKSDRGLIITLNSILFDVDKAQLKPGAQATINQLADLLSEYENRSILVEGFTDSTGPEAYNQELSRERAAAVKQALANQGIDSSRIDIRGYGEQFPVATNDTTAGRQLNRRVEIVISNGDNQQVVERSS